MRSAAFQDVAERFRARAEHFRALEGLTVEQRDELDDALRRYDPALMSTRRALEWMFNEAVRRGWLLGPA